MSAEVGCSLRVPYLRVMVWRWQGVATVPAGGGDGVHGQLVILAGLGE